MKATVHAHTVVLSGTVPWHYQRDAAQSAVADIPGVREVRNLITLKPPSRISVANAKSQIASALVGNARLDVQMIHVTVVGSVIRLTGRVPSLAERRQAGEACGLALG